jgi:Tol biopolymer transport system component
MVIPSVGGPEQELAEITFESHEILNHGASYELPPPFLAWSADSRWLLSLERKATGETSSIVRVSVETGEKHTLTAPSRHLQGDGGLALSPDGKALAFVRAPGPFERDIYLVSRSVDMTPRGEPQRLTFDGKEIMGSPGPPTGIA